MRSASKVPAPNDRIILLTGEVAGDLVIMHDYADGTNYPNAQTPQCGRPKLSGHIHKATSAGGSTANDLIRGLHLRYMPRRFELCPNCWSP